MVTETSSECSLVRDIHNSLTESNIWKVSITRINDVFGKIGVQNIYQIEQTCTIGNDLFKDSLKLVLFDCNRNRAYVHRVKLYYFVNIEMQVGITT